MATQNLKAVNTVTISRADAEHIMELYNNVEAADAHFMRCQSDLFRQHVQGVYKAMLVANAYANLRAAINRPVASKSSDNAQKAPSGSQKP